MAAATPGRRGRRRGVAGQERASGQTRPVGGGIAAIGCARPDACPCSASNRHSSRGAYQTPRKGKAGGTRSAWGSRQFLGRRRQAPVAQPGGQARGGGETQKGIASSSPPRPGQRPQRRARRRHRQQPEDRHAEQRYAARAAAPHRAQPTPRSARFCTAQPERRPPKGSASRNSALLQVLMGSSSVVKPSSAAAPRRKAARPP